MKIVGFSEYDKVDKVFPKFSFASKLFVMEGELVNRRQNFHALLFTSFWLEFICSKTKLMISGYLAASSAAPGILRHADTYNAASSREILLSWDTALWQICFTKGTIKFSWF